MMTSIINIIVGLIIGTILTKWLASKKHWDSSYRFAFVVNLPWVILILIISILESFYERILFINYFQMIFTIFLVTCVNILIAFVINTVVSSLIVQRLYQKEIKESLIFVIYILIILNILLITITFIRIYFFYLLIIL